MELDFLESMMVISILFVAGSAAALVGCIVEHFIIRARRRKWL